MKSIATQLELIKLLKKEGVHPLGENLYIRVGKKGATFQAQLSRKTFKPFLKTLTLGKYPDLSLKDARLDAAKKLKEFREQKAEVAALDKKEFAGANFKTIAWEWYEENAKTGRWGRKSDLDQRAYINEMCNGKGVTEGQGFGNTPMNLLTKQEVSIITSGITNRGAHNVVRKLLFTFNNIVDFYNGKVKDEFECQVYGSKVSQIKKTLPPKPKAKPHPFLRDDQMPLFLAKLSKHRAFPVSLAALKVLLYTGVRTSNVRFSHRDDFNLETNEWFIYGKTDAEGRRTKNEEDHLVPLSKQCKRELQIIMNDINQLNEDDPIRLSPFMFYGNSKDGNISENTIRKITIDLGYKGLLTPHGFRHTLSTWANGVIDELVSQGKNVSWTQTGVEEYIQHKDPNKMQATYNHRKMWNMRTSIAQAWADQIDEWTEIGLEQLAQGKKPSFKVW
jgi:integrase